MEKVVKERVIQFGEGGFLRGFADWMLQIMKEKGLRKCSLFFICSTGNQPKYHLSPVEEKIKLYVQMVVYFILKIRITLHPSENDLLLMTV